ncbi:MAG: ImmA/IrrE family metallo-endopeptidase [Micromonosporaceae bacterium]|nr:ImmA/IrrE family metallo-endopeptidase [Micromonosporaceae bacterium]
MRPCDNRTMTVLREWVTIGQRVREARLAAKLSQDELGRRIGLDRTMIAKIEAGTRRIDAVELVRLGSCLDVPLDHFLHESPAVLSRRGALVEEEATGAGRSSFRLEAALMAWLRDVRQLHDLGVLVPHPLVTYSGTVTCGAQAREAATWLRERFDYGSTAIPSLMAAGERAGLPIAVIDLPGDGACVVDGEIAVAVVSKVGDPGRRRTTAAHELGHLVLGDEYSSDLGTHASRADREAIIDAFAAEFLLPCAAIRTDAGTAFDRDALVRLAAAYRTSWSLAVRQAARAGALDRDNVPTWLAQTPTRAELLDAAGWVPQPDLEWERVPGAVAHAVMLAYRQHLITAGRAVELMRGQITEVDLPQLASEDDEP